MHFFLFVRCFQQFQNEFFFWLLVICTHKHTHKYIYREREGKVRKKWVGKRICLKVFEHNLRTCNGKGCIKPFRIYLNAKEVESIRNSNEAERRWSILLQRAKTDHERKKGNSLCPILFYPHCWCWFLASYLVIYMDALLHFFYWILGM